MIKTSNLTPEIEDLFFDVYTLLDAKAKGEDIGALTVRDAVKDLEAEVEKALTKAGRCPICEAPYPVLCDECAEEEAVRWDDWAAELSLRHAVSVGVG